MVAHSGFITVARKVEPGVLDATAGSLELEKGLVQEASGEVPEEQVR
jgi:hypothetical protein